jgi:hypothetical protein
MTTTLFRAQYTPTTPFVEAKKGTLNATWAQAFMLALFNRTGGATGIPFTSGASLVASGATQAKALQLVNDYNEVLSGSGGVSLFALQPAQSQVVFNGSGSTITVFPASGGQIDGNAINAGISLGNNTFGFFTAFELLAGGGTLYRSFQLFAAIPPVPPPPAPISWTPPVAWTPTDQSGAGLVFTAVNAFYQQIGNLNFVWGVLKYPATASGANATISLPVAVPNARYAESPGSVALSESVGSINIVPLRNTATAIFVNASVGPLTNNFMASSFVNFSLTYPMS